MIKHKTLVVSALVIILAAAAAFAWALVGTSNPPAKSKLKYSIAIDY